MGRYNFRPQRVHQAVTQLLGTERLQAAPPWHDIVGTVPPSQILVRTQPVQHHQRLKTKKSSKLFQPQNITYPEDRLRKEFFSDHPWELARPRVVLENDGMDARMHDWSKGIRQPGQPLSGERYGFTTISTVLNLNRYLVSFSDNHGLCTMSPTCQKLEHMIKRVKSSTRKG